jgi:NRAMP (natural resistance-associated macrophage protein)-like metal ion transporter
MEKILRTVTDHPAVKHLGPGLITGAADDDPSGIATYSQAGAQFGFNMLWTVVFTYPLMAGIQMVSARLGCISGKGLAANIREQFPVWVLYGVVALLLVANTINIAADIAAMAEATRLLAGGSTHLYAIMFGLLCLVLQVFMRYETYVRYLKWLTLALLSYVAVVFTISVPWLEVVHRAFLPSLEWNNDTITVIVAVFGTTISPYLFFWQAAQEMEDLRSSRQGREPVPHEKAEAKRHLRRIKWDTLVGMGFSNLVAFFIILSTAATLHLAGVTNIQTSAQAAEALRPLAGDFTFLLFSLGIIGTGLLAIPVLAGSAAYAVAEALDWRTGLDLKPNEGQRFYSIVAVATIGGVILCFTPVDPMKELFYSAVINGVIAVPIMAVMMVLGTRESVMGAFAIGKRLRIVGWLATLVMAVAVVAMFATI